MYVYEYAHIYVHHLCSNAHGGQKRVLDPLGRELETVVEPSCEC